MTTRLRRFVAGLCITACAASLSTLPAGAGSPGGAIDGILLATGGEPASGWEVLLLNPEGDLVARSATTTAGSYEFTGLPAGRYRLGLRDEAGNVAPVAAPATVLATGACVRQDVRLAPTTGARIAPAVYGARADSWWSRQTRNQKILTVVGIVVGAGAVWAIYDAVTNDEKPASAHQP